MRPCHQINLQRQFGGGEVYAAFVARALRQLGRSSILFVNPEAGFWKDLLPEGSVVIPVRDYAEAAARIPDADAIVLCHAPASASARQPLARHRLACFAHMPAHGRATEGYRPFRLVLPVSGYVRTGLLAAGLNNVHDEALYGVADLERGRSDGSPLRRGPLFDWDRRKLRDRLLGLTEPVWGRLIPRPQFRRVDGALHLAIVSRITTIKQFPLLFSILAPILAQRPDIRLEVFGSGGFASMRDLRRSLRPLGSRVRWWGHQRDVAAVYAQVDYVLTGLPEREALGLNVIEAQACGTPVLAVDAPPFTETVVDGVGGYLYADPRSDGGASFAALLDRLPARAERPDPLAARGHLDRFSPDAFRRRLQRALERLDAEMEPSHAAS